MSILQPKNGTTVARDVVDVHGTVADPDGIASVRVERNDGYLHGCAVEGGVFVCEDVELVMGTNVLDVVAVDRLDASSTASITVVRDESAPHVLITYPTSGTTLASDVTTIEGTISHPVAIDSVQITGDEGATETCSFTQTAFTCTDVSVPTAGTTLVVTAIDVAGDRGSDSVTLYRTSSTAFEITLEFYDESFTRSQRRAFIEAANVWGRIITNDLEDMAVDLARGEACPVAPDEPVINTPPYSGTIDDLLIFVTGFEGSPDGVLGYAGPCSFRGRGTDADTNLVGYMEFDTVDLERLERDDQLVETIVHEMGHVIGIGTNWEDAYHDLLRFDGDRDVCRFSTEFYSLPRYIGDGGRTGYAAVGGGGDVPVEDEGGGGTACGHWDEETFGNELMTGWLEPGANPLSELTIRSLTDIGFQVDVSQAEAYRVGSLRALESGDGYPIGERERILLPRASFDPVTGEYVPLPVPR